MARKRTIDPDFWSDDKVTELVDVRAYVLYLGTISQADDMGRLAWSARQLLARLFPTREDIRQADVQRWMDDIERVGLIRSYEIDGRKYAVHPNWARHQYVSRPIASKIPDPPFPIAPVQTSLSLPKARIPDAVRREVALRYGCPPGGSIEAHCDQCGKAGVIAWSSRRDGRPGSWVSFTGLELDHMLEEQCGGQTTADNLRLLCRPCNVGRNATATRDTRDENAGQPDAPRGTSGTPRAPSVSVSVSVSDTVSGESNAREFARWFCQAGVAAGVISEVDVELWARRNEQGAMHLLGLYPVEQCQLKAERLFAVIAGGKLRRTWATPARLVDAWEFTELAQPAPESGDGDWLRSATERGRAS